METYKIFDKGGVGVSNTPSGTNLFIINNLAVKSFNSTQEYLKAVLADPDFPTKGSMHGAILDKFYVENGRVYLNFTNSLGQLMRYYFYFGKYNMDGKYTTGLQTRGDFWQLVYGTEFTT